MKYKVGDIVRIVDNILNHQFDIGDTVTIMGMRSEEDDVYYAQRGGSLGWYVCDEELEDVLEDSTSETYSPKTTAIVEMFMGLHSGKMSDSSRIEWPTAVNIAKIYLEGLLEASRGDYDYDINELENTLIELNK